ncbi:heme biosynthesis protein HemY, partial [Paraburkholderia sp. SIMBA_049]
QLAAENLLRDRRHNADALLALWHSLSPTERHSPRLADTAAELLVSLNRPQEARKIVEEALAQNWDARLLRRYPDTAAGDALPLIQKAEGWKKDHPDDADLLFALGRLCQQQQLWGKAQSFLEAALKQADN